MRDFHDLTELGRARRLRRVVDSALAHYDLDVVRVRLITNETNGVFRVDTSDRATYAVRVGLGGTVGHSATTVAAELAWMSAIRDETDLTVPAPVPTRSGDRFVTVSAAGVPDARNVVVFSWLPGPLLGERLTVDNVHDFGTVAAHLHEHGRRFTPADPRALAAYDRVLPFHEADHLAELDERLLPARAAVERWTAARTRVESAIARLRRTEPMRVLHGDLHPWNAKIHLGRVAVFDFEDLMWGWPIQDIATTLYYFHGTPEYRARRDAFADGYRSVAPWPADHDLDTFLIARGLVLANYVLASPELAREADGWMRRFDQRITALVDGTEYVVPD